ncbi:MAG: peptidylprolyl isomerase [Hyphomicrobium sp.]
MATVDGKRITETDLRLAEREIGAIPKAAPKEARRLLIELLIQRQVLAAAAEADGLQTGTDFAQRIDYARRTVLQDLYLEKQARAAVTEADAKRIYDEQSDAIKLEEEVRVRHIQLEGEATAQRLREKIVKGADFETLAKTVSADLETAPKGGDLGWRTKSELPDALAAPAFALQNKGDLSFPIETKAGWHLIVLEQRRPRALPPFSELKDPIIDILVKQKASELARGLREKATVVYDDVSLKPVADAKP